MYKYFTHQRGVPGEVGHTTLICWLTHTSVPVTFETPSSWLYTHVLNISQERRVLQIYRAKFLLHNLANKTHVENYLNSQEDFRKHILSGAMRQKLTMYFVHFFCDTYTYIFHEQKQCFIVFYISLDTWYQIYTQLNYSQKHMSNE